MEVTALLNQSSSAVDQHRKGVETLRLPTRSRTPWDAGGYSLPLSTAAMKITSPEVDDQDALLLEDDDSTTIIPFISAMPTSSIHKFTDSRSSLSSFTSSSLHSASHSRYSSISTLNSPRTLTSSLPDPLLSPQATVQSLEMPYFRNRDEEEVRSRLHHQNSPTKSLDTLAQIAEDHHSGEELSPMISRREGGIESHCNSQETEEARAARFTPRHSRSNSNGSAASGNRNADVWVSIEGDVQEGQKVNKLDKCQVKDIDRPTSPSDTLLIKRTAIPTLHLDTTSRLLQIPYVAEKHPSSKSHKRATSAPNFAAMNINRAHAGFIAHEPTPPTSNHPDRSSPQAPFAQSPPESPPTAAISASTEPVCMYIDDCDTDSPQRKAISHIFGRNKMCTRMIPEHLWVHLCRKHYQRCRYRDQDKWAKAQCDLVQLQIRRIHDWSMSNQVNGSGICLQNWTLTMRKREKLRREKLAQEVGNVKRKRGASTQDDDEGDTNERDESGYPSTTTKIPDWLVAHCDKEFTTQGILVIFNRLHRDILENRVGPHFPDLELLPNLLSPDGSVDKKGTKPAAKAASKKAHQRSQSLNTPIAHESSFRDNATKRRRPNEDLSSERGFPTMRPLGLRPSYPSISEHEVSDDIHPQPGYYDSLPTPTPQRMNSQSMAAHLEAGNYRAGRPMHSRSQSDVSAFSQGMNHSSDVQMGSHYYHLSAAANSRSETEYQTRMTRVDHSLEYPHVGLVGGRDYERNSSLGPRGQRVDENRYGIESQERTMGPLRQSVGPRQQSMGVEEYSLPRHQSPLPPRDSMAKQHEMIVGGQSMNSFGHNRHNSSPAKRSQYHTPQAYSRPSPTQYNSDIHACETQETRDFYGARR